MATLTIGAARLCGCPRSTLQRAIRAGRLHLDPDHRLDAYELTSAGYLPAPAALQEHAPAAQQSRPSLGEVLRDMQRTLERLATVREAVMQELQLMQQERSSRAPVHADAQQPRRMEPSHPPPTGTERPGRRPRRFPVPLEKFLTISQSVCFHDTALSHLFIPLTS